MSAAVKIEIGVPIPITSLKISSEELFKEEISSLHKEGGLLNLFFALPEDDHFTLLAVMSLEQKKESYLFCTRVKEQFESLTPQVPQAHWFEREIRETWNLLPRNHPWLKPIRFSKPYTKPVEHEFNGNSPDTLPGVTDFFSIEGEDLHEVAVGPVHAGIIEPGHFRFLCRGEKVLHLEISLGYQHRGIEKALLRSSLEKSRHYMETAAGDTTIGHTTTFCRILEGLSGKTNSFESEILRALALELERLANHTGDLGALSGDVGYLPTQSFCGRIRGDLLNLTAHLCGNRFGRGFIIPGGTAFALEKEDTETLLKKLKSIRKELTRAVSLLWNTPSVLARFEHCGVLTDKACRDLGIVGPAARAAGLSRDCRINFPSGVFRELGIPLALGQTGDVFSRAWIRWKEIENSFNFLEALLKDSLHRKFRQAENNPSITLKNNSLVFSLTEGWRGEICHAAVTDDRGGIRAYKVVDPSFHNWFGLALTLRGQEISDFPLCNKSFNLSYCGHDL